MKAWVIQFEEPISYQRGLDIQYRLLKARQADEIPDTVLILQHTPTITLGNRGRDNYLLKTPEEYKELGIDLFHAERGGDVTYHAPGQWVLSPIMRLGGAGGDSHNYLWNLEEIALRTLADFGIEGFRREGKSGAWIEQGKLAAIGFRLKRWVSFHGMSFNVNLDLSGFQTIVPCGLVGQPVASLQTALGEECPSMNAVRDALLANFSKVCKRELEWVSGTPFVDEETERSISASAPGSLMLLGEHAVLHGRRALVCAINQRIRVTLTPLAEPKLKIISDLGRYEAPLKELPDHPDFRFVLDAVKQASLTRGIELKIESEFSSDIGFGSSAAVTVATHAVLMRFCRAGAKTPPLHKEELFSRSLATIHRVQGRGSGADVAASVLGGVIAYRAEPLEMVPLTESFPLTAVYSGSKMKTVDVIRYLEERRALNADYFEKIFDRMDASIDEVIHDFSTLGKQLVLNQKLMEEMGLCNAALSEIIQEFHSLGISAKISGSGLGDCAIGLGQVPKVGRFSTYPLTISPNGAGIH